MSATEQTVSIHLTQQHHRHAHLFVIFNNPFFTISFLLLHTFYVNGFYVTRDELHKHAVNVDVYICLQVQAYTYNSATSRRTAKPAPTDFDLRPNSHTQPGSSI